MGARVKQTLSAMIREGIGNETALDQLRRDLEPEEQAALDAILSELRGRNLGAALASSISPMERVLFLIAIRQQQRIDCLEFIVQRHAASLLQTYLEAARLPPAPPLNRAH